MSKWKRADDIVIATTKFLLPNDNCLYARDYVAGFGFSGGETNNLILNFKKLPGVSGQSYRDQAVQQFASEASVLVNCSKYDLITVTAMPSSKVKSDPDYDCRFEDMFTELSKICPCAQVEWPITAIASVSAAHQGGSRNPEEIAANFKWNGFSGEVPPFLLVFDDVLTTGAHFRAYSDFARANGYGGRIHGVFWAKCG